MRVEELTRPKLAHLKPQLMGLLMQDPVANIFLIDQLELWGSGGAPELSWWVCWSARDELISLVYGNYPDAGQPAVAMSATGNDDGCYRVGKHLRPRRAWMLVGPRGPCDGLWEGLGCPAFRVFYDQRLYCCTVPPQGAARVPVPAGIHEVEVVAAMQSAMLAEDLGIDPRRLNQDAQRRRIAQRITDQKVFVLRDATGVPEFCIDAGNMGPEGTQVGGTFTRPSSRGQGLATEAMRGLCRTLLARVPRVTLHVNEANTAAVRVYERSGFTRAAPFRLMAV